MLNKNQISQTKEALLRLGFSEKDSLVYLSVLQNGESSIPLIAKDTGLSRGTIYDLVEKLKTEGYLAEIKKGKKRRLIAENPTNKFYNLLDKQHEDLEKSKKIVEDILPTLKALDAGADFKPQIRVYSGEKGFRQVWDEILSDKKDFLSIARMETFIEFGGEKFLEEIQKRKAAVGISSRAINENSPFGQKMQTNDIKYNRQTILAPKEFLFPATEIIFSDKIAMFSTRKEKIILVIESKDFAQTHRIYFEMMWKFLEKTI
jgi:sugar-specific transcriptional regulator TrmB